VNDATGLAATAAADDALTYLSISEAARLIAARKLSPVDLVHAHLDRIVALNGRVFGYITVLADEARAQARAAEQDLMRGGHKGPLHGIPYSLKDNYNTKGVRTTAASRLMWDFVPDSDASLHTRLRAAGGVLLGKNNTWEYGTGTGDPQTDLPYPVARNPWNLDHFTAGSSTGTGASVAAGMAMAGLGSDTGGSVRAPAAAGGTIGLKPTHGRLSRAGILPNSFTLDSAGPITRTVEDNAIVLQALAGHDPVDPTSVDRPVPDYSAHLRKGVKGLRIGYLRRFHERDVQADPQVVDAMDKAVEVLRSLGAEIVDVDLPYSVHDYRLIVRVVGGTEALSIHEQDFRERHAEMGAALRDKFLSVLTVSGVDYVRATRFRRELTYAADAAVASSDAVICAGPMTPVPRLDDHAGMVAYMLGSGTCVFNVSGHPSLSICTGFDRNGLPLNMQIASRYWDEATLLRVAYAYEQATPWHDRHPGLA
jgi:aspartyl-tRNA(Asn)/glutamyl-tRNA(Gln) amidotransferase subunit A